ncbi:hypothetical protein [Streptococcus suis]
MQEWIVVDQFGNQIAGPFLTNSQQNFLRKTFQMQVWNARSNLSLLAGCIILLFSFLIS